MRTTIPIVILIPIQHHSIAQWDLLLWRFFKLLLNYGAIPFTKDSRNVDALTTAIEYGNKEMVEYWVRIKNHHIFWKITKIIHIWFLWLKIKNAEEFVKWYIFSNSIYDFSALLDENMNNLLMISCLNDNPSMVNWFIYSNIDVQSQNKNGNNILLFVLLF